MLNYVIQKINSKYSTTYRKGQKYEFDYIKPDDFDVLRRRHPEGDIRVAGYFYLHPKKDKDGRAMVQLQAEKKQYFFQFHELKDRKEKSGEGYIDVSGDSAFGRRLIGFVHVGDNCYLAVLKPIWFFFLIPFLFLLLLLLILQSPIGPSLEIEDGMVPGSGKEEEIPKISDDTQVPLYTDVILEKDKAKLSLLNPEGNKVYFVYEIMEGESQIYKSKAFKPGKMVEADLSGLSEGKHDITINIHAYDLETEAECNGATQNISVFIK